MDQNRELVFRDRANAAREEPRVNQECQWGLEAWASETALGQRGWEDDTRALIPKGEQRIVREAPKRIGQQRTM